MFMRTLPAIVSRGGAIPPVTENDSRFISPLHPMWGELYYGKCIQDQAAGVIPNGRKISGTLAFRMSGASFSNYPRVFEWSHSKTGPSSWQDAAMRVGFGGGGVNPPSLYLACYEPTYTNVCYFNFHTLLGITVNDGAIHRIAFNIDLDDLANSYVKHNNDAAVVVSGASTGNPIPWNAIQHYGVLIDTTGVEHFNGMVAGDGIGMYSISNNNDLDLDAVFDENGYFTNPGKHFLNWYASRPLAAFISAPYVNQGSLYFLSGRGFNHNPASGWDYQTTSESRHMKTITNPGGNGEINAGVTY